MMESTLFIPLENPSDTSGTLPKRGRFQKPRLFAALNNRPIPYPGNESCLT